MLNKTVISHFKRFKIAYICAAIFAAYAIGDVSSEGISIFDALFVKFPLGFLLALHSLITSSFLYVVIITLVGFAIGEIASTLWNWKKWTTIILLIGLVVNYCGYSILILSVMD